MRRNRFLTVVALLAVLIVASAQVVVAQVPTGDPNPDGPFDAAYVTACKLMADARRPENAAHKEALLSEAVIKYTESLTAQPGNPSALINRGVAHYYLGQWDEAVADYTAALRVAPGSVDAIKDRGTAYEAQGKLQEAVADYEAFLSKITDAPSERRLQERALFTEKVKTLRSQLGPSKGISMAGLAENAAPLGGVEPDIWGWNDYYGNAKTHNVTDNSTGITTPNQPGFACQALYPGYTMENAVWFGLPALSSDRTAWLYNTAYYYWYQTSWDHYYASATGWTPLSPNTYYLQVPNTDVCLGYNPPANYHKINCKVWVD